MASLRRNVLEKSLAYNNNNIVGLDYNLNSMRIRNGWLRSAVGQPHPFNFLAKLYFEFVAEIFRPPRTIFRGHFTVKFNVHHHQSPPASFFRTRKRKEEKHHDGFIDLRQLGHRSSHHNMYTLSLYDLVELVIPGKEGRWMLPGCYGDTSYNIQVNEGRCTMISYCSVRGRPQKSAWMLR
jgi:hypothetical protein